jgi:tetratricopeptide (TPR) repeat protein
MSVQELRAQMLGMLAEVRSAGRGASRSVLDAILDARLPVLAVAADGFGEARLTEATKDRLKSAVSAACSQAREGGVAPHRNGRLRGIGWPWVKEAEAAGRPKTWAWRWSLAGVAALTLSVWALYSVLAPRQDYITHSERPGTTGPEPPIPQPPSPKPDGPVVEKGPETKIESQPVPSPRERERVAVAEQPIVGEFARVMGEPQVRVATAMMPIVAKPGTKLAMGSIIETGDMDKAEIRLVDGTTISLDFNSIVEIPGRADPQSETRNLQPRASSSPFALRPSQIKLPLGRIWCKVTPREDNDDFLVVTPVATAEVLGTEFLISVERRNGDRENTDSLQATLEIRTGEVAFYNSYGKVVASDLMRSTAIGGSKPTEPVRIRSFPAFHLESGHALSSVTQPLPPSSALSLMSPYRDWCGLQLHQADGRVLVDRVRADSEAQRAGFAVGDVLLAAGGRTLSTGWEAVVETNLFEAESLPVLVRRGEGELVLQLLRPSERLEGTAIAIPIPEQFGAALHRLHLERRSARQALAGLARAGGDGGYWNNLGLLWEVDDRYDEALKCLRIAAEAAPYDPVIRHNFGHALMQIGNYRRAEEEFARSIALASTWLIPRYSLSELLLNLQRTEEALHHAQAMVEEFPMASDPLLVAGRALMRLRRYEEARAAIEQAILLEPEYSAAWDSMGTLLIQTRDLAGAEKAYRRALLGSPDSAAYLNNLGNILRATGRPDEAEQCFRQSLESKPYQAGTAAVAHANLGSLLHAKGKIEEAEVQFRAAIRANPEYLGGYNNYAWMLTELERFEEAERLYRQALSIDPRDPLVCANLGILLFGSGRGKEAVELYREYLRMTPGTGMILHNLSMYLTELNMSLDEALEAAKLAVEADPSRANRHQQLGWVHIKRGELDAAEAPTRRALELFPDPANKADCWENLALIFEKRGDIEGAKAALRKALELVPGSKSALETLKRIGG